MGERTWEFLKTLALSRRLLRRASQAPKRLPCTLGTSENSVSGAGMLHLKGGIQNSREQGGHFPLLWVPHPSTPGPKTAPMRNPGTSGVALTSRDLRKE